jgi:hypothetical protein
VTCPASVTYTGSALEPCTASVTGAGGLNQSLAVSYVNNVVGLATASADYAGDPNHQPSSDSESFLIVYSTGLCLGSPGHQILQPINPDGSSVFKQGSTVPAKFRVCDAGGNSVGVAGVVTSFRLVRIVSGTQDDAVNEPVISTTPDTAFRWSSTDQQWIYNINTKNLTKGRTYYYQITLADTSVIAFSFGLK